MKHLIFLLVLFIIGYPTTYGQEQKTDFSQLQNLIPQEKVFIHYNSSLIFPGEYLYYKLYTLDLERNNLSNISKIAYVEIIDATGKSVIKQKLNLIDGMGQGDIFIPTALLSGNYKIVGYTKWMRNGGSDNYFSDNITIINPYRNDQEAILSKADTLIKSNPSGSRLKIDDVSNKYAINLSERSSFGKREKISFDLKSAEKLPLEGNFSISVRRKDGLDLPNRITSKNFLASYTSKNSISKNTFLPDLRGDLFSGRIIPKNGSKENLKPEKIAISVPDQEFSLRLSETDTNGNFKFILDRDNYGEEIFLEVIGEHRNDYNIEVDHASNFDFSNMKFEGLKIDEKMRNYILERSVYNQIENSYYSAKPDTLKSDVNNMPFYGSNNVEIFKLEDYTRFKTVQETFIEIITNAKIKEGKNKEVIFEVFPRDGAQDFGDPALLLIDGVYIQDTNKLMEYDARNIEEIRVLRDKYYYGPKVFRGIVEIQTRNNDYLEGLDKDYIAKESIIVPQQKKIYFKPNYAEGAIDSKRIPDFRTQLLWEPNLNLSANSLGKVEFYTSDVAGNYEIVMEGFTVNGEAVSLSKEFAVK